MPREPRPRALAKPDCPSVDRGFTLVELLVVIAIVVLLAAILAPSLRRAKRLARNAVCMSNMHQQYLAFANYATANQGRFPQRSSTWPHYAKTRSLPTEKVWDQLTDGYLTNGLVTICPVVVSQDFRQDYCDPEFCRDHGGGNTWGAWDSGANSVVLSYNWFANFAPSGEAEYEPPERPWPTGLNDATSGTAMIAHQIQYNPETLIWCYWYDYGHDGGGGILTDTGPDGFRTHDTPVTYGDGSIVWHDRRDIHRRAYVRGRGGHRYWVHY